MKKISQFLILILIIFLPIKVLAYSQEIATTHAYYSHPVSGEVEDAGNNPGIGQAMTESVLGPQALFEEANGSYYLTIRINMANHISDEAFFVEINGEKFYETKAQLTGQGEDYRDYRFEVPSKEFIGRLSLYIEPMGRNVIFYYTLSNFQNGNTDFETLQNIEEIENENFENDSVQSVTTESIKPSTEEKSIEKKVDKDIKISNLKNEHGLLLKGSPELEKINNYEQRKEFQEDEIDDVSTTEVGEFTKFITYSLIVLFFAITFSLFIFAVVVYLYAKKLKVENDLKKEKLYEE